VRPLEHAHYTFTLRDKWIQTASSILGGLKTRLEFFLTYIVRERSQEFVVDIELILVGTTQINCYITEVIVM
jgi:hypothetical protein